MQGKRTSKMPSGAVVLSRPLGQKTERPMWATPQRPRQPNAAAPFPASARAASLRKKFPLRVFILGLGFRDFPSAQSQAVAAMRCCWLWRHSACLQVHQASDAPCGGLRQVGSVKCGQHHLQAMESSQKATCDKLTINSRLQGARRLASGSCQKSGPYRTYSRSSGRGVLSTVLKAGIFTWGAILMAFRHACM